jgi:hypothetical protein
MEKELENPEKKKKGKQPSSLAGLAQPSQAVRPRALPLSLVWPVGPTCRRRFLHLHSPPLSLPREPGLLVAEPLPRASPSLSLRRGPALSDPPSPRPPWTGECALAHVAGFLGHDTRPRA